MSGHRKTDCVKNNKYKTNRRLILIESIPIKVVHLCVKLNCFDLFTQRLDKHKIFGTYYYRLFILL